MSARRAGRLAGATAALAALAGVAVLGGCDGDADADDVVLRVVAGTANGGHEFRFDVPDEVTAGPTRIVLENAGTLEHHAQLFRLDDGADVEDLASALASGGPAAAAEVGAFVGGTGLVSPGARSRADAVVELRPGTYVLLCLVPDADGVPHLAHGMMRSFEVAPGAERAPLGPADHEVRLVDYGFELPDELDGGATLAITNASTAEVHEMVVARLGDGDTVDDVLAALHAGRPLPAEAVGGMQAIPPGATQRLQLDLEPGRYVVVCAVPAADGTPHYDHGMVEEVVVT